ncbi:MAG: hypothetical protein JSW58_00665, partial [Candidatus Latescibacterota bacterium]
SEAGNLSPKIATVSLRALPLKIEGDTLRVSPWYLVFGSDPDITVKTYDLTKHPNPFCPSPHIRMINLVPDTLVVTILEDEVVPTARLYCDYIERGAFEVRIDMHASFPPGRYRQVEISVGEETKRERTMCN